MNRKNNALKSTSKSYCQGATMLEACLAFALVMVSVLGCLSALQMAIKRRYSIENKTWALTEMEMLADRLRGIKGRPAFLDLLEKTKKKLEEKLPGSHLFWGPEPTEKVYKICFSWRLGEMHRIQFIVMPADFH
jgi:hypothetical protein